MAIGVIQAVHNVLAFAPVVVGARIGARVVPARQVDEYVLSSFGDGALLPAWRIATEVEGIGKVMGDRVEVVADDAKIRRFLYRLYLSRLVIREVLGVDVDLSPLV